MFVVIGIRLGCLVVQLPPQVVPRRDFDPVVFFLYEILRDRWEAVFNRSLGKDDLPISATLVIRTGSINLRIFVFDVFLNDDRSLLAIDDQARPVLRRAL